MKFTMIKRLPLRTCLPALLGWLLSVAAADANLPGGGTGTGANVTVTDNGDGTVTMANGVVSIHVVKNGASINQINYTYNNGTGTQTQNLLAGGKNGGTFYWEFGGWGGSSWAYSIVANTGSYAEIDLLCDSATNGAVDIHFSMLRGSPGFYVTPIWSHRAQDAAMGTGEERDNIYIAPYFNWMSVNDQVQREGGINATYAAADYSPQENSLCTSGPLQGTYDDKYKWSADFGVERVWGWSSVSDSAYGVTGKNVGIWHVVSSWEFYNGGPLKPELNDAPMVNMINGGHYYFGNDSGFAAGEVWTRVSGPYFIYVNNVTNTLTDPVLTAQALYADAKAQAAAEATAWPYSWMNNTNYASSAQRGTVTGQIAINDSYNPGASASNLWVGVEQQPAVTLNHVYDFQLWSKPYEFWTKTDANGNFVISNVIAGNNYTLYAFGPGASGMFMSQNQTGGTPGIIYALPSSPFTVVVAGGATNNLGVVTWTPARVGPTVFEIGYPTRKGDKFRHGDDYWVGDVGPTPAAPSPIWTKFMEFPYDFPGGLNYTVGQNRWNTDWNFIQSVYPDFSGNNAVSSSTATFNLAAAPASGATASLLLGIASDDNSPIYVTVNGTLLSGGNTAGTPQTALPTTGWFPINDISDANIREENHGGYSDERLTFAGSLLHAGNNTINFSFRQAGGSGFTHHFMYDYIRLELTGYVPPAPASVTAYAGNNSVLLSWPAVAGATSYNLLRSTTSGSGYVSIMNGVTGPVCGSGPANATYVDGTAANGTTYYYVVQSVNPVHASGNSPPSTGVAPAAGLSTAVPAAPAGLTVTGTNNAVTFTWNAVPGANFYTVYRGTVVNALGYVPFSIILSDTTASPSYTDAAGTLGCTYSYYVTATSAGGTGGASATVTARPVPPPPASAPGNFHLADTITSSNQTVTVSWSAVSGAVGYILYRANSPAGPFSFPGNYVQSVTTGSYTDGGLATNTLYTYRVVAMNAGGISTNSVMVSTPPAAPAGLYAYPANARVTLTWTASVGATNYVLQRGTSSGSETTTVAMVTNTTYADTNLINDTTYYYVVTAVDSGGASINSPEVNATPSISAGQPLIWSGAVNANWDIGTTANWTSNGLSALYQDGKMVQFDDSAPGSTAVNASAAVSPAAILVNNSTLDYTISGSPIAGPAALTKSGPGTLTLTNASKWESYTGPTVVNGGTLVLGFVNSGGLEGIYLSSGLTINAGGTVVVANDNSLAGATAALGSLPVTINAGGLLTNAPAANGGAGSSYHMRGVLTLNGGTLGGGGNNAGNGIKYGDCDLDDGVVVNGGVYASTINVMDLVPSQGGGTIFNVAPGGAPGGVDLNVMGVTIKGSSLADTGIIKRGNGTMMLGNAGNTFTGPVIVSGGTLVAGANAPSGAAGAFGNATSAITLGDANTVSSNASPALLIGGPFTVGRPILVTNLATTGTYMIGGGTDDNAAFSGAITVNQPLTIVAAAGSGLNALTISGGITAGSSGLKPLTLAGPGNVMVTATAISDGSGQVAVNVAGGTLTLAAANTYSGATTATHGLLQVNGSLATGSAVTIGAGGVLGGSGVINGPATVQDGGTLAPGGWLSSVSTLTFSNALTLAAGSTSLFEISPSPTTNDVAKVSGALTCGGTLIVTNISGLALAAGDSFRLFDAARYGGAFTNVQLPVLAAGQGWNTNSLNAAGTISIVALTAPAIAGIQIAGGKLVINGSGGPANWNYYVLTSTNLAAAQWTPVATHQFDAAGNFILTNVIDPHSPPTFYRLQLQ
jgi:rhamnogalacturonan endolyase